MASTYKILGQVRPADTNPADLYTVPAGGQTVTSTLAVANLTAETTTYRIYVRKDGATASESNALVFDAKLGANSTEAITIGLTLDAGDIYTVQSGTALALTFQAFGLEIV
jgi:hypothetical protein